MEPKKSATSVRNRSKSKSKSRSRVSVQSQKSVNNNSILANHPHSISNATANSNPPNPVNAVPTRSVTPPHPASAISSSVTPPPSILTTTPSPQGRAKIAREKFQSLILSANQVIAGTNNNDASPPKSLPSTATGHMESSTATALGPQAQGQFNGVRTLTISASAKTTAAKNNPNQFPNIDPRSFPKTLGTTTGPAPPPAPTTGAMVKVSHAKSMGVMGAAENKSKNFRAFVEKAIAEHKVFSCVGVYPAIKNALKKRGWVEKTGPINAIRSAYPGAGSQPRNNDVSMDGETDAQWMARMLRDYPPDFIWVIRRDNIDWRSMHKDQIINRYPRAWFTTKVGLAACLQNMHWYSESGFSETFFPRCYRLCLEDEKLAFQEDYRLTACMSFLRYFVENYEKKGAGLLVDPQSRITPLSIDFATRQLGNYVRMRRHEDIDWLLPPNFMSQHWDAFIHQYYMVVHEKKKIRFENVEAVKTKYDMAKKTLQRTSQYWPQAHLDGVYNMWICKPGARSRGKGIVIMNTVDKILDLMNHGNSREANWVVQKYMERPMLIYKTKFDIRQWFVITDWSPLTVWFYKESYVRFCTKPYVLEDFHESIHLCNNAIQCQYKNAESRDAALPDENMWDSYTFQAYLKSIGKLDMWAKIYNGMKHAIVGVLLASQESVESRKGCFELYGADFMLSEDMVPWLIEINSCPCMASTTSITARMCAQCLEDTVKLIIDRRTNKNAETGMYEMVYRQPLSAVTVQQFTGHDLVVHGKKLTRDIDWPGSMSSSSKSTNLRRSSMAPVQTTVSLVRQPTLPIPSITLPLPAPAPDNLTFSDLLQKLRTKNTQMFQGYLSNSQAKSLAAVAGPDAAERGLTGTLLKKMRALNKMRDETNLLKTG